MKQTECLSKERIKLFLKKLLSFFFNPKLLLCFFIGWMITNGWSYIFFAIGTYAGIDWMIIAGGTYMGLLWMPFTPEKIITFFLAIFFLKLFFPGDRKTLAILEKEYHLLHEKIKNRKTKGDKYR